MPDNSSVLVRNASSFPPTLAIVYFFSAVSSESAFDAETLLGFYKKISGIAIEKEPLAAALASISGHMANNACRTAPAKLPRLRWLQKRLPEHGRL